MTGYLHLPLITHPPSAYLPATTASTSPHDLYPLPGDTDRTALAQQIADAMGAGSRFPVLYGTRQDGALVLNGAALPFAVVTVPMDTKYS